MIQKFYNDDLFATLVQMNFLLDDLPTLKGLVSLKCKNFTKYVNKHRYVKIVLASFLGIFPKLILALFAFLF